MNQIIFFLSHDVAESKKVKIDLNPFTPIQFICDQTRTQTALPVDICCMHDHWAREAIEINLKKNPKKQERTFFCFLFPLPFFFFLLLYYWASSIGTGPIGIHFKRFSHLPSSFWCILSALSDSTLFNPVFVDLKILIG